MPSPKSTKSPAFQFYPRDFLSSGKVDDMSMTERGIYITLLCRCWLDGGLPNDTTKLARIARMKPQQFDRLWSNSPLRECFYLKGEHFQNDRLDRERKAQAEFRRRQSENGRMGGRPKKPMGNSGLAVGSDLETQHKTQPEPKKSSASTSASSSAICDLHTDVRAPLIARRRLDAAWEGPKGLYVPQRKHADFVQLRNHPGAEAELLAWYGEVADAWHGSPGADMMRFWTARYDEKWPATEPSKVDTRTPEWVRRARAGHA